MLNSSFALYFKQWFLHIQFNDLIYKPLNYGFKLPFKTNLKKTKKNSSGSSTADWFRMYQIKKVLRSKELKYLADIIKKKKQKKQTLKTSDKETTGLYLGAIVNENNWN